MFRDNWSVSQSDRTSYGVSDPTTIELQTSNACQNPRLITVKTIESTGIKFREIEGLYVRKFLTNDENEGVFAEAGVSIGDRLRSVDGIDTYKMTLKELHNILNYDVENEVTARNSFVSKVRMHVNGTFEPPPDHDKLGLRSSLSSLSSLASGCSPSNASSNITSVMHQDHQYDTGIKATVGKNELKSHTWVFIHYRENEDYRCHELQKMSDIMLCAYIPPKVAFGCVLLGIIQALTVTIIATVSPIKHGVGASRLTIETALANAYAAITIAATMYPTVVEYSIKSRNYACFQHELMEVERKKNNLKLTCIKWMNDLKFGRQSPKMMILWVDMITHISGALSLMITMAYQGGAVSIILNCTAILAVVCLDQIILPLVRAPVIVSKLLKDEYSRCAEELAATEGPDWWILSFIATIYTALCVLSFMGL